ncbi:hypothetical protein TNCT_244681 [Trichonephila clavata]|uniref:Uncharacterized protein n=1 Tax=Trichonephila clavata TaxID=2740835 RepID=A0A8X6G9M6_TRICU|nr:hypothetical protein TNCT_244681 [Trichonephila clavata]
MTTAVLLKDKTLLSFDDHWPIMQPIILKLLHQEAVSRSEWQDLFGWCILSVFGMTKELQRCIVICKKIF